MKDLERKLNNLTRQGQTSYSKYGDSFMEGKPDMPSQEPKPTNSPTKDSLRRNQVSPEKQEATREVWDELDKGRVLSVDERRVREEIIKRGLLPISGGSEEPEVLNQDTPGPTAGGAGQGGEGKRPPGPPSATPPEGNNEPLQEPENERTNFFENLIKRTQNEQLKSVLQNINKSIRETGSPQDLKDEFLAEQMAAIRKLIDEKKVTGADQLTAENLMSQLSQLRINKLSSLERLASQERDPELRALALEIIKVFSNDRVREELVKDNLNLNTLPELKNLIDKLIDPTKQDILIMANTITDENGISIQGKENLLLSEESKRLLYEWLIEKIISIPDSTPDAHYNIGSFYITANLDSLIDTARRRFDDDGETGAYLNELRHYRQAMHELHLALKFGEQYKEFVLKELSSNGFDFVNNHLTGTAGIIRLYEKTYANKVREKRKWLIGQDVDEVDNEVRKVVNEQLENGEITTKKGRVLTEWEKERALRLGRILFSGSQRKAIYSGFGDIPADTATRIGSVPDEYIVRSIYDWKIFAPRFFGSEPAPRRFIQHVFKHTRSLNPKAFDNGVLGVKPETLIENSFGGYDMQSHGWRSELLFLGNQLFVNKEGERKTLEQILNAKIDEYTRGGIDEYTKENVDEGIWGYPSLKDKAKDRFSNDVRRTILGQKTYLSSLVRYGNFSSDLKADIWTKRASLMPSTAITLLPDEMLETTQEKELWERMRHKVYRAEERRVQKEALDDRFLEDVYTEAEKFDKGKEAKKGEPDREFRYEFVNSFCKDFTSEEKELLKNIIDKVYDPDKRLAKRLAETNMSFTLIIDDTPSIAWKKKGGEYGNAGFETADFIRLLASDQDNFTKGWGPMVGLTESPQSANVEVFEKAVEPIGQVVGREAAQKKIEPFIAAITKMYSTDTTTEFTPGFMTAKRILDKPTSEIEKYFKKTYISWTAEKRKDFFIKLLQTRSLGNKGFERMRKETRSTQEWVLLTLFKFWVELVGAEAAYQIFKVILPEEMSKAI